MFFSDFYFPKAAEAANSKMTGWRSSELIGDVDLTIFREIWPEQALHTATAPAVWAAVKY